MTVGDVVAAVVPVDLDGRQRGAVAVRDDYLLEPPAAAIVGRQKVAVELAGGAVCGADDVAERDQFLSWIALAEQSGARVLVEWEGG